MYDGKLGMHVPEHFDLLGNTKYFSAWKSWLNRNTGYRCTNAGGETINTPICTFKKFIVDTIHKKLWKNFDTGWRKVLMMMTGATDNEGVSDFLRN